MVTAKLTQICVETKYQVVVSEEVAMLVCASMTAKNKIKESLKKTSKNCCRTLKTNLLHFNRSFCGFNVAFPGSGFYPRKLTLKYNS